MKRTYDELMTIPSFMDRYKYLRLGGKVGDITFGAERYFNQVFYASNEWKSIRRDVIIRDGGCDLGIEDRPFAPKEIIFVHHMNPISLREIENCDPVIMDPNYLISCSLNTHNAIHYGNADLLIEDYQERTPFDTIPWRKK